MPISPPAHYVNIVGEACVAGILSSYPQELSAGRQVVLTPACSASAVIVEWLPPPGRPGCMWQESDKAGEHYGRSGDGGSGSGVVGSQSTCRAPRKPSRQ